MMVMGQLWNFVSSLENLMANWKSDLDWPWFVIALCKAYRLASERKHSEGKQCNWEFHNDRFDATREGMDFGINDVRRTRFDFIPNRGSLTSEPSGRS